MSSVSSFCKTKGYYYWKNNFWKLCVRNPASWLLQICQKFGKWQWRQNFLAWRHRQFFDAVSLVKFSYWSKIQVNIITSSGIMTVFFYKRFTRNPDIGNTPVWVLPNISRLEQAIDTNIATNVSNRVLLNSEKLQSYSFYRFWVINGKPTGGVKLTPTHPG